VIERDKKKISATVLVVDDDILVRMPIAAYLRHCGYRVIEAASSSEAMTVLNQLDLKIDAVLADAEQEDGAGGFALAKWVREHRPYMTMFLAGTPSRTAEQAGELCSKGPSLSKPYDHAIVEAEIRRLLSARQKLDTV
jgi:DNA-binding response OmpR family regulator